MSLERYSSALEDHSARMMTGKPPSSNQRPTQRSASNAPAPRTQNNTENLSAAQKLYRRKLLSAKESAVKAQLSALSVDNNTINLVISQAEAELEYRRMRNRAHQAKHKLKQKLKLKDLEKSSVRLRE
ncbi:unnamed protein product [Phytophthora lilii]|uniref:Unnamed protein product n=1 Tax=Phytophthora lilii TaxID=2077276 RepID=A0A9W6TKT3_9STRA|nr:unnamed protein product [Phytophthora lilii]